MVQNSETTPAQTPLQPEKYSPGLLFAKQLIVKLTLIALAAGVLWYIYQNPQLLKNFKNSEAQQTHISRLENQINVLQNELRGLQTENADKISRFELDALNKKIENIANINNEILDSKASNAAIIGLLSRVDELDTKTKALSKVSSQGALILTAAMLVKDAAATGKPFEYEAEVLKQLATGTNMEASAEKIAHIAPLGIASKNELINQFNQLFAEQNRHKFAQGEIKQEENAVPNQAEGWKEKINSKLNELIIIEYHEDEEKNLQKAAPQDEINKLVNEGKLEDAITRMNQIPEYKTAEFDQWQNEVKSADEFRRALNRIQALTLAVMKAENLKNLHNSETILP